LIRSEKDISNYHSNEGPSNFAVIYENSRLSEKAEIRSLFPFEEALDDAEAFISYNLFYIVSFWLIGIIVLSLRLSGGYYYLNKIKHNNIMKVDVKWYDLVANISEKLLITKNIELYESSRINFPSVIGYFKPVILVPVGFFTGTDYKHIELIMAHELAHVKRNDYLLNLVQSFIEIIYFFNPSVWLISRIIRNEREYSCDDLALSVNNNKEEMAKALIYLYEPNTENPQLALSFFGNKKTILGRIKRMLTTDLKQENFSHRAGKSLVLIVLLLIVSFIACTTAGTYSSKDDNGKYSFERSASDVKVLELDYDNQFTVNQYDYAHDNPQKDFLDLRELKDEMAKLKFELDRMDFNFNSDSLKVFKDNFNREELRQEMQNLVKEIKDLDLNLNGEWKEELKNIMKDLDFEKRITVFSSDEFKRNMKKLSEDMKALEDIEIKEYFDSEEFKNNMNRLENELSNLDLELKGLDIDLSGLDDELENLDIELKKLDQFMDELRNDLANEGYLNNPDENFNLYLGKDKAAVNGTKLPDYLHDRYLNMYKNIFGHDLENSIRSRK
jgi:beta-lactamase regulating signal transducer with metallopeptidase domain